LLVVNLDTLGFYHYQAGIGSFYHGNELLLGNRSGLRLKDDIGGIIFNGARTFPEDFANWSLLWTERVFRDGWFMNGKIDEEEKYHEPATMTPLRKG
jgi:hypothetical protein